MMTIQYIHLFLMQSQTLRVDVKILDQHQNKRDGMTSYDFQVITPFNKWFMTKRFDEFEYLHRCLEDIYHGLPTFPEESIFDMIMSAFSDQKEDKRKCLEKYLKGLAQRKDIITSKFLVQFFQFTKNSPQLVPKRPTQVGEFSIDPVQIYPTKGVKDFYFDPELETFIFITSDTNPVSRIGSYLFNSTMPWEQSCRSASDYVGSVECWKVKKGQEKQFERLWIKIYPSQALVMEYSKNRQRLYIGLDNGQIDQIQVSSKQEYKKFKSMRSINIHNEAVTGIYFDESSQILYTVSEDGLLNSLQTINCTKLIDIKHDVPLSCLLADRPNNRIFVGGDQGNIFLYDTSNKGYPKSKVTIKTPQNGAIRSMKIDNTRNYLFSAGFDDGLLAVFDVEKCGKQKLTKQIAMLQGKQNPRTLIWVPERMQIIVGMQDGTVCFWDSVAGQPIYQFHAHVEQISKMYYDYSKGLLITAAEGQQIKFWRIPTQWRDTKVIQIEETMMEQIRLNNNIAKMKEKARLTADNSDDDDLIHWSNERNEDRDIEIELL